MAPGDDGLREARGIARALTGDLEGGRADLEGIHETWRADEGARRRQWIDSLGRGENPFTPEVLDALRAR
jgi:hypothetical protein